MASYSHHAALLLSLLLLTICALGSGQVSNRFLQRFPQRSTDALGAQMNKLFDRIDVFSPPQSASAVTSTSQTAPLPISDSTSSNVGANGELPPPPDPETVPQYRTLVDAPPGTATSTMIILHGLDSSPEQLRALAILSRVSLPGTRFVFVRAPKKFVTYLNREATSWFDILQRRQGAENFNELRLAAAGIERIVRMETVPTDKIVILGMSQGGAVALTFFLAEDMQIAGVIVASTWLPVPSVWSRVKETLPSDNIITPLFVLHGNRDTTILLAEANRSVRDLRALGRKVDYKVYQNGGHTLLNRIDAVVPDIIAKFKAMIR